MQLIVVVAQSYDMFNSWCDKSGIDSRNRKLTIPLVSPTDAYRLLGRDLSEARFVKLGTIEPKVMTYFKKRIKEAKSASN